MACPKIGGGKRQSASFLYGWTWLLGACAPIPAGAEVVTATVTKPAIVRAIVQNASQLTPTNEAKDLIVDYQVTLELQEVIAGAPVGSMDGDVISVRLAAGNSGYFRKGNDLIVLLDPKLIANGQSIYWRRFTRFACIETAEAAKSGIAIPDKSRVQVGDDICLFYGP